MKSKIAKRIHDETPDKVKNEVRKRHDKVVNMKTGIELIAQERQEQIEKHGFSLERDEYYTNGELFQAASYCLELKSLQDSKGRWVSPVRMLFKWPKGWSVKIERNIRKKSRVGQLIIAGAFLMADNDRSGTRDQDDLINKIAAEIDRLNNL